MKFYNNFNVYGYVSNLMYWLGKYLFFIGELNVLKKSISFLINYICI